MKRTLPWYVFPAALFAGSAALFYAARQISGAVGGATPPYFWDAGWYHRIVTEGYSTNGADDVVHDVVFFPLYPALAFLTAKLFRLNAYTAMLVVSLVSTLGSLLLLDRVLVRHCPPWTARFALFLLAFSPYAVFNYCGYSEPVFLLAIAAFFYFLLNRNWYGAAALAAGAASAARPYGCLLSLVFAFELLRQHRLRKLLLFFPLCFAGLAAYTVLLGISFGDPLAFEHNLEAWAIDPAQGSGWENLLLFRYLGPVIQVAARDPLSPALLGIGLFVAAPLLLLALGRKMPPAFSFFLLLMFLFFHYINHGSSNSAFDLGRHLNLVFPLAVLVAMGLDPERLRRLPPVLRVAPAVLAGLLSIALFVRDTLLYHHLKFV